MNIDKEGNFKLTRKKFVFLIEGITSYSVFLDAVDEFNKKSHEILNRITHNEKLKGISSDLFDIEFDCLGDPSFNLAEFLSKTQRIKERFLCK